MIKRYKHYYYYSNLDLFLEILKNRSFPFLREIFPETFLISCCKNYSIVIRKSDLSNLPSLAQNSNLLNKFLKFLSKRSSINNSFFRIIYEKPDYLGLWSNRKLLGIAVGIREDYVFDKRFQTINCFEINLAKLESLIIKYSFNKNISNDILNKVLNDEALIINPNDNNYCQIANEPTNIEILNQGDLPLKLFWAEKIGDPNSLSRYFDLFKYYIGPYNITSKDDLYKILCFYGIHIDYDYRDEHIVKFDYQNSNFYPI